MRPVRRLMRFRRASVKELFSLDCDLQSSISFAISNPPLATSSSASESVLHAPLLPFFPPGIFSFSKRTSPSCFGDPMPNSQPASAKMLLSKSAICVVRWSDMFLSLFSSTCTPRASILARTETRGRSIVSYVVTSPCRTSSGLRMWCMRTTKSTLCVQYPSTTDGAMASRRGLPRVTGATSLSFRRVSLRWVVAMSSRVWSCRPALST
mmetsp:Transcript_46733/g.113831  ORF Transcript_46733/g.113831 Transcript_46733/m.113831 type:complete len:209 (-) Transcript_46733:149-775(-)